MRTEETVHRDICRECKDLATVRIMDAWFCKAHAQQVEHEFLLHNLYLDQLETPWLTASP